MFIREKSKSSRLENELKKFKEDAASDVDGTIPPKGTEVTHTVYKSPLHKHMYIFIIIIN